ncbi:hypothetical protein EV426DRAFT_710575 [Tirmania nivea]|nr:hypothetical protein EV426DRAFT_710575 [Tirmania nivea]
MTSHTILENLKSVYKKVPLIKNHACKSNARPRSETFTTPRIEEENEEKRWITLDEALAEAIIDTLDTGDSEVDAGSSSEELSETSISETTASSSSAPPSWVQDEDNTFKEIRLMLLLYLMTTRYLMNRTLIPKSQEFWMDIVLALPEDRLAELTKKDRAALSDEGLIDLGRRLQEAKTMKQRIENETCQPLETRVGKSRQVFNGEIFKTVEVVMGHTRIIDAKGKVELEGAVAKVNMLLRTTAITMNRTAWIVTAKAGTGEFNDESTWSVGRVAQDIDPIKVAGEVGKMLVQVFGRTGDILNVWVEGGLSVKMIAPSVPLTVGRDRKALAEKLKEENNNMKGAKRMPKVSEEWDYVGWEEEKGSSVRARKGRARDIKKNDDYPGRTKGLVTNLGEAKQLPPGSPTKDERSAVP